MIRIFAVPIAAMTEALSANIVRSIILLVLLVLFYPVAATAASHPNAQLIREVRKAVNTSTSFRDKFAAQVWLMDMSARLKPWMPDASKRLQFLRLAHEAAARAHVAPELVLAVIQIESAFRRFAISSAGARGYMQIMPFWPKEIGKPDANLFQTRTNLVIGCTILRYYLKKAHGDLRHALAAYNGRVDSYAYSDKVLRALSRTWYRE